MKLSTHRYLPRRKTTAHWFAAISALGIGATVHAAVISPSNILISREATHILREVTTTGGLVQSFSISGPVGASEVLRDVVAGSDGSVYLYNGTFTPVVTTLDPLTGTTSHRTSAGFSTISNSSYGGIASLGSYVYATDMATFSSVDSPLKGIIRFDLSNNTATRFATGDGYQDLTIGGNGLLYALPGENLPNGRIDVFNPNTMELTRSIALNGTLQTADLRGIAVNYDGSIYAAAWNGSIYALDSNGAIVKTRATGFSNLSDIDIDSNGKLVVGGRFGNVVLTTTTLLSQTSFNDPSGTDIHVAWTSPIVVSVPEPAAVAVGLLCLGVGMARRRRCARVA